MGLGATCRELCLLSDQVVVLVAQLLLLLARLVGLELLIFWRDSVHQVREGLLQIVCRKALYQLVYRLNIEVGHQVAYFLPEKVHQISL